MIKFQITVFLVCTLIIALTLLTIPDDALTHGATFFVDKFCPYGCADNTSHGSELKPWCTISYAVKHIRGGDTLFVKTGTYNEPLFISGLSGTLKSRTAILAFPNHSVTIQGLGINSGRIKLSGCNYLTFSGFHITLFNQGIFIERESTHITIQSCTVSNIGQEGIHVKENCSFITIDHNKIYDTDKYIYNGEGIYIGTGSAGPVDNTHHIIISNNVVYNVGDEAIELKPGTHDCIVEGNTIHHAISGKIWGVIEVNQAAAGVQNWAFNPNHIIRNNIIHDTNTAIRAGTGCMVYNNIIYDVNPDNYGIYLDNQTNDSFTRFIYHNTIDVSPSNAIYVASGLNEIINNIGPSLKNNLPSDSTYYFSIIEETENYHLKLNSTPIDQGIDLTRTVSTDIDGEFRPGGTAPDFGADEFHPLFAPGNLRFLQRK